MDPKPAVAGTFPLRADVAQARHAAWERLSGPGSWWTGAQRIALARLAREARNQRQDAPWLRERSGDVGVNLPEAAREVARTVSADAHRIDREWALGMIAKLGDAAYVEIVGLVACVTAADAFAEALGVDPEPLPEPRAGEPDRIRPEGVGDIGAHVAMTDPFQGPNVFRAMSLVPAEQMTFFGMVGAMYAMEDFNHLVWDRPLSRPQVELVAARVSSINECFY